MKYGYAARAFQAASGKAQDVEERQVVRRTAIGIATGRLRWRDAGQELCPADARFGSRLCENVVPQ